MACGHHQLCESLRLATLLLLCGAASTAPAHAQSMRVADESSLSTSETRTQDNVVVVFDASGSMNEAMTGGRRIDVAKASLLRVLESVPATTNVGILVFSGRNASGAWWLAPLGPLNMQGVRAAIANLQPNGGTPLGDAMRVAADALIEQRAKQLGYGTFRLLVLTDGEATDKQLVDKHLPLILKRGVRLDVIGLEMKQGHSLATRVNSYRAAGSGDELSGAIAQVFAEVGGTSKDPLDPELFKLSGSLNSDGALGVLSALRDTSNDPLLGPAPGSEASSGRDGSVNVLGNQGSQGGQGSASTPSGASPSASASIMTWLKTLGLGGAVCAGVGIVVLWGLISLAKQAARSKARALDVKAGRKGRAGW
jgi:hypothetical protein